MEILDAISLFSIPSLFIGFLVGRLDLKARIAMARHEGYAAGLDFFWQTLTKYWIADIKRAHGFNRDTAGNKSTGGNSTPGQAVH